MSDESTTRILYAFRKHQAGDRCEAERVYREILANEPQHLDACQLLGAVLVQDDRPAEAIPYLLRAIEMRSDVPEYYVNLGTAHSRCRDLDAAVRYYQQALRLQPQHFDAHRNLGSVLTKLHRFVDALTHLWQAFYLHPTSADVRLHLGIALLKAGREDEAVPHFEFVLQQSPHDRRALAGLGQSLSRNPQAVERALDCWQRLVALEPDEPAMHNNLATILKNAKRFAEAEAACRRSLELRPGYFPALCNLGVILAAELRFEEARICLEEAVANEAASRTDEPAEDPLADASPSPTSSETWSVFAVTAYCQLAMVCNVLGDLAASHRAVERALAIDPEHVESHMMRGFLHLECGELEQGWPEYEWRRRGKQAPRRMPGAEWKGEHLPDQSILLHAEQGLGDTIQFVRYARLVRQRVGRVILLAQRPLVGLLQTCRDVDEVVSDGDPLPAYAAQIPLLSLPAVFQTSLRTVPADAPYLDADPELVDSWRRRLAGIPGFRVGICWQGNREYAYDGQRSVPLRLFGRLAEVPGVRLICLQKGDGTEQLQDIDFEVTAFPDLDATSGPFMDTAAIMRNLDLVISSDTATPHLAGALGVPVWLATSAAVEWRWLLEREDNPWYPTLRLFRQTALGDWSGVFDRMRDALQQLVAPTGQARQPISAIPIGISPGELADKITILQIKLERIRDPDKLANVRYEHEQLKATAARHLPVTSELEQLTVQLKQVNERLWEIEDEIRDCEREQQFGERFIELARSVYFSNDRRSEIKHRINALLGSVIVEEKSYTDYQTASLAAGNSEPPRSCPE